MAAVTPTPRVTETPSCLLKQVHAAAHAAMAAALREHRSTVAHYGVLALWMSGRGLPNANLARRAQRR